MVAEWTNERIRKLIDMYRDRPCLWKLNHEHYTNKKLKDRAYAEIVNAFRSIFPQASHNMLKTKIQNIRGSYRKELRKIEASKKSAKQGDEQYTPSLWYFDLLAFTKDQERDFPINRNSGDYSQNSSDIRFEISEESASENYGNEDSQERFAEQKQCEGFFTERGPKKRRSKGVETYPSQCIRTSSAAISNPSAIFDDCSALGIYIAEKLRKMEGSQQILAEALIQKVITKGLKNKLTDSTDLLETPL
uniref:Sodium/hydrogen exchanger 3 n=1 Tax=Lygus hesperus TaxID=30085 RepID=A0A0A9WBV2_LYGHE